MMIPDELKFELKEKSGGLLKENSNEIQIFCPYCDDAYRKPNPKWGHLYIGKNNLLFFCHRCGAKGHLIKLLKDLEIDYTKYFRPEQIKGALSVKVSSISGAPISSQIAIQDPYEFLRNPDKFLTEIDYIYKRTNLEPHLFKFYGIGILKNEILFKNLDSENWLIVRYINQKSKIRYKKLVSDNALVFSYYYLKHRKYEIPEINSLIVAEGTFDIVNIFNTIPGFKGYYVSSFGKYYQRAVSEFLIYAPNIKEVHIFLDSDIVLEKLSYLLKKHLRVKIAPIFKKMGVSKIVKINFYKNPKFKDFGEISHFDYEKINDVEVLL